MFTGKKRSALGLTKLAEVPVRLLSTGQAKRAALARVAASGAPLWLLDEPANGLDSGRRELAWRTPRTPPRLRAARSSRPRMSPLAGEWARLELGVIGRFIAARCAAASAGPAWLPAAFFLLVATLVPFASDRTRELLERIGGRRLWIATLTAALLPIERLVEPDRADGVLDQLSSAASPTRASPPPRSPATGSPSAPLLLAARSPERLLRIRLPAELAGPAAGAWRRKLGLAALAVAVAALTAGLPRAGALAGLLLLPLAIPLLIFGAAASGDSGSGRFFSRRRSRC
jgi:heme exporter protein B